MLHDADDAHDAVRRWGFGKSIVFQGDCVWEGEVPAECLSCESAGGYVAAAGWFTPNEGQTAAPVSTSPMAVAIASAGEGTAGARQP